MASPPVVKFLDFGQYKYELTKREKEAKRRQRSVTFKEVRLTPKIGSGDFDTKVHRAIEFLEDGDRIKVTVRFRGRELTHPELGRNMLARFTDRIKEHGTPERAPLLEGKSMHLTVASVHKPKEHEAPGQGQPTDRTSRRRRRTARHRRADGPAPASKAPRGRRPAPPRQRRPRPAAAPAPADGNGPGRSTGRTGGDRSQGCGRSARRSPAAAPAAAAAPKPAADGHSGAGHERHRRRRRPPATRRSTERRRPARRQRQESEARVPKIKSHKAAQKRIGVTGSGKVIRVKAWRGHHLEIKSSRRTRRYAGKALMTGVHAKQVRRLLPYL